MKRLFWIAAGIAIAAFALSKAPKTLGKLTGSRSFVGSLVDSATDFFERASEAMKEREDELREEMDV
ncbi:MAG: hypothetical protein LBR21_10810 [Propionibacteriaceae bacterium]|jgi:hypothetical protein|nr:hypothetical protein [Propionibacteriaceae bacterium]